MEGNGMTKTETAVDRALLGLHLSQEEETRAWDWLAAEVESARDAGRHRLDLPSDFNTTLIRRTMKEGLVSYFWECGAQMHLSLTTQGDQPAEPTPHANAA
jgi:hypothetical protein